MSKRITFSYWAGRNRPIALIVTFALWLQGWQQCAGNCLSAREKSERAFYEKLLVKSTMRLNGGRKFVLNERRGPQERTGFIFSLDEVKPDSVQTGDNILTEVVQALDVMPANAIEALARTGCRVVIVRRLSTTNKGFKNGHPTGYSKESSWDAAGGAYDVDHNIVFIPRQILTLVYLAKTKIDASGQAIIVGQPRMLKSGPAIVVNQRIQAVVGHELGHALDAYLGRYSESDCFKKAYLRDKEELSEKQKMQFAWYLQLDNDQGCSETFAELFNNVCGAGSSESSKRLYAVFPHSYLALIDELANRHLVETEPSVAQSTQI